jgi:protein TonB
MKEQKLSPREDRSSEQKSGGAEQDHFTGLLARSFEEKPIWSGLYESLSDAFFPPNLPPLELTSTPVPTPG